MRKKILYSCDTGIDDALAIAYLLAQKECEVVGITVSYGMGHIGNVYRNTMAVLKLFGREDIPVVMGSETPLSGIPNDYSGGSRFHGCEGLGGVLGPSSPEDHSGAKPGEATDFILGMIERYGQELYWVTSGPLTDIARVLRKDSATAVKAGAVYVMGGAIASPGNTGTYTEALSEANVRLDIPATAEVLDSKLPVVLVGLDVTRKTLFSFEDHERWHDIGTKSALFLYEALKHYLGAYQKFHPYLGGCGLHDPLAAVAAVHPEILTTIPMHMMCFTEGPQAGKTTENVLRCNDRNYEMEAALFVDVEAFSKEFFGKVEALLREH